MITIISGGQTGADVAGLDAAITCGFPISGYCPAGRKQENGGTIPLRYPLIETVSTGYLERTEKNVIAANATFIFYYDEMTPGSKQTASLCVKHDKVWYAVNLKTERITQFIINFNELVESSKNLVINIAGSRESKSPGIYNLTYTFLCAAFFDWKFHEFLYDRERR